MRAFWLSSATRVSASSIVDATIEHGLDAGLRLTARIRRKLLAIGKRISPTQEPTRYLAEVRRTLQRYEPELAITLSDAALLAWLRGGRSVASFLPEVEPGPSLRGLAPPGGPPWARRTATGEPWDDHELVLVKEAAKDLARRRVMTPYEFARADDEAKQRAFTVVRVASEDAIGRVRDAVTDAVANGKTLRQFREVLAGDLETSHLGEGHVENVFRTAVAGAFANGQEKIRKSPLVVSEFPFAETLPIRDSRLTDMCRIAAESGLEGTGIYAVDDSEWERTRPSRHFQCFIPGTIVQGRFSVGFRQRYAGKIVEMVTAAGNRLAVTCNHPIVTASGLVAANELSKGDDLLRYACGGKDIVARLKPKEHKQYRPAVIEDVFRAFMDLSGRSSWRTPATADDFHGDAAFGDGNVDIVVPNRKLLLDRNPSGFHRDGNFLFSAMHCQQSFVSRLGLLEQRFACLRTTPRCVPGATALPNHSIAIQLERGPFDGLGFGPASHLDASLYETSIQNISSESSFLAQPEQGLAGFISRNDGSDAWDLDTRTAVPLDTQRFVHGSQLHTGTFEDSGQSEVANPDFAREMCDRFPGIVSLDKIVEIRNYEFSGHVYDLQGDGGWIVADNIFASNCRCGVRYLTLAMAAARLAVARRWRDSGRQPPLSQLRVPRVPIELPAGWSR